MEQLGFDFFGPNYDPRELALLNPDEIYQMASARLLGMLLEDHRIERKRATIHMGELAEYFSMWANSSPHGGVIVIGQENTGEFSGCLSISNDKLNQISKMGLEYCPDAKFDIKRVPITRDDGHEDYVLVIRIYYNTNRVVHTNRSRAYYRCGDSKIELKDEIKREMEAAKGQVDFENESSGMSYPEDFDMNLVDRFISNLIRRRNIEGEHSNIELLVQRRLGKMHDGLFHPNNSCALIFAKDPVRIFPGAKIRILRYEGERELTGKEYNVVKDIQVEGPIPNVIVEAGNSIRTQLRDFSYLHEDGQFYSTPEYPEDAWYEALVNACVHRSYILKNIPVFVKIFDDRIVVESPGAFPPSVTPETIYETHSPRNPHLMTALFYLDFVKCHNEGTRRIRDSMQHSNLPMPEFIQKEMTAGHNTVVVTLRNNIAFRKVWVDSEAIRVMGDKYAHLKEKERRIVNFVAENGSINVTQTMRLISTPRTWQAVKKLLMEMVGKGLLSHHHSGQVQRDSHACFKLPDHSDST